MQAKNKLGPAAGYAIRQTAKAGCMLTDDELKAIRERAERCIASASPLSDEFKLACAASTLLAEVERLRAMFYTRPVSSYLVEAEMLRDIVRGVREVHDTHQKDDVDLPRVTAELLADRDKCRARVAELEVAEEWGRRVSNTAGALVAVECKGHGKCEPPGLCCDLWNELTARASALRTNEGFRPSGEKP